VGGGVALLVMWLNLRDEHAQRLHAALESFVRAAHGMARLWIESVRIEEKENRDKVRNAVLELNVCRSQLHLHGIDDECLLKINAVTAAAEKMQQTEFVDGTSQLEEGEVIRKRDALWELQNETEELCKLLRARRIAAGRLLPPKRA